MEKELSGEYKNFSVYFFNDLSKIDEAKQSDIVSNLNHLAKAFYDFTAQKFQTEKYAYTLNINLVDEANIKKINQEYRKKNKATDVLSFPLQENLRGGKYDNFLEELELGDIFVCDSICEKQASEFSITFIEEFLHLVVHGFLHVCGYDHEKSETEEKLMEGFEEEILAEIKKARA